MLDYYCEEARLALLIFFWYTSDELLLSTLFPVSLPHVENEKSQSIQSRISLSRLVELF